VAYIQKVKRKNDVVYRVFIRRSGLRPITKTFNTKRLANSFVILLENDRQQLLAYDESNTKANLSEVVDLYLLKEYKGARIKDERQKLDFWVTALSNKQIFDVTTGDISIALDTLPAHLKNTTINRYKAAISVVFTFAITNYGLISNPAKSVPFKPENNARIRFLSIDERRQLFEACKASHWKKLYLLVLMAITTGARKGELTKLRWSDIDFDRQTSFVKTSKNGEPKVLPLTDSVIKELQLFNIKDNSLIFASTVKPDKSYCFTKPWYRALKDADIQDFRFHDLRHSCASYLAMNGASLLEIADVLGHKQIQMTKRYAHLCIDHKQRLINKVMGGI